MGGAVGVHRTGRIVQEGLGDALEREGGPEHRIPLTRRERARGELRGAAVGHACDDAQAFGQAGLLRRVGADVPEHAARELYGRQHVRVDVQLLQHLDRPAQADQVVAGLERVAGVGGDRTPDELRRDHVGLVGEAGTVAQHAFVAPPQQLGQCPRGLDPVTQPVPQRVARLLRLGRERACPGVVVHQPGCAGGAVGISDQHGARCAVHRNACDRGRGSRGQAADHLAEGVGRLRPPLVGVLLVTVAVAAAGQRAGCGGEDGARRPHGNGADALGAEVDTDPDRVRHVRSLPCVPAPART